MQLEILALRHQLGVLQRSVKKPKLNRFDRVLWAWFCGTWTAWRSALCIVKPDTVIAWHRKGYRLLWTWKVRRGQPGRPAVPKEIRKLIRQMSRDNQLWGAPRIHGELLKLGIDIGETSVSKYMVRRRNPPSQTWRTFLENHLKSTVSIDFFTVPTVVPVNSDLADTVGVEHFPSILSYGRVIGVACRNAVAFPNSRGLAA